MRRLQAHREVAVTSSLGPDHLLLHSMSGSERLSRPYRYDLVLLSEDPAIDFDEVVGQPMAVRLMLPDQGMRCFHGIVSRFVLTSVTQGISRYEATIVPHLWLLTRTANCRIFQEQTIPDIIKQVFHTHHLTEVEDALTATYPVRDYCVQYRETDFNFVSRLMEQEGISYFFEHDGDVHRLVLADAPASHAHQPGYEQVSYAPPGSEASSGREVITSWTVRQELQPGRYALDDFDFRNPRKNLQVRSQISNEHDHSTYEVFDYPGEFTEHPDGERYARIRLEELQTQHETLTGRSNARGLSVGSTFELINHPRPDQNREYLVVGANYRLASDGFESGSESNGPTFSCTFDAIDAKSTFRPARETPRPVIQGPQTAIVTGKAGEEIWTDEHGRVKVIFPWDRRGKADETSSCWIRVAQMTAGKGWGAISIPRIGQEVIVEFLEGDPDAPIITGRVYNGESRPPYPLPEHASISTVKTNSTKGGGGFNEIRFQDKKGEEQLFLHAERDLEIRAKHNRHESIACSRHLTVGGDQRELVSGEKHETVRKDLCREVEGDNNLIIGGADFIDIHGSREESIAENLLQVVKGNSRLVTETSMHIDAGSLLTTSKDRVTTKCHRFAIAGSEAIIDCDHIHLNAGGSISLAVGSVGIRITSSGVHIGAPKVDIDTKPVRARGYTVVYDDGVFMEGPTEPTLPRAAAKADPGVSDDPAAPEQKPDETVKSPAALVMEQAAEDGTPFVRSCDKQPVPEGEPPIDESIEDDADGEVLMPDAPEEKKNLDDPMFDDDGTFSEEAVDHAVNMMQLEDSDPADPASAPPSSSSDSMFDDDGTFSREAVDHAINTMQLEDSDPTGLPTAPASPGVPDTPQVPGMPDIPRAPGPPGTPAAPSTPGASDDLFDDDGTFSDEAVDHLINVMQLE